MAENKVMLKAIYSFKGSHNDELNFKKGAIITLTQKEDGGWWEGTLDGKTGWFPSNYVKEISSKSSNGHQPDRSSDEVRAKQMDYRQQVVKDLLEKEQEFVSDLRGLYNKYLVPLHNAEILRENEYRQLAGNIDELVEVHAALLQDLDDEARNNARDQRMGKVLLHHGSAIRSSHQTYWANHPKAVVILERFKDTFDKFMESQGAVAPGLMFLTTALSKPLRHLEKYAGVAQELQKNFEDDHPDRGDTQRSIGFFMSVSSECAKLRRQKELELEVISGTIRDWEGDPIGTLGEVIHMGSVAVGHDHKDRYLLLFPGHLLILSVSARMSAFIYQGKLPLSGISVSRLEDTDTTINSFEITGPMIERILVVCQSKPESLKWVEMLQHHIKLARQPPNSIGVPYSLGHKYPNSSPAAQIKRQVAMGNKGYLWKMSCLRPAPPTRSFIGAADDKKKKKDPDTTYEEDMQILRVIEAYCTSNKRQTQAVSTFMDNSVLVADEKVIADEAAHLENNKNVAETVYNIRDQIVLLSQQNREVVKMLEEEINARKRLEAYVKAHVTPGTNNSK